MIYDRGSSVVQLKGASQSPELLRATYDEVLRPSFSVDELPGYAVLLEGFAAEEQTVVVLTEAGAPAAAAVTGRAPNSSVGLLSYLAVRSDLRGQGRGTRLLRELQALWAESPADLVLGEVHDPRFYPNRQDERATARLEFYARAGAQLLEVPWLQPALSQSSARVENMLLLVLHRVDGRSETVRSEQLEAWIEGYFAAAEGQVPADPGYLMLLARVRERRSLRLMAPQNYRKVAPLKSCDCAG